MQFDDAGGALEELRKDLYAAQEVLVNALRLVVQVLGALIQSLLSRSWVQIWELGLDTTRNRIIRTDLMMSMGTLSVSLYALISLLLSYCLLVKDIKAQSLRVTLWTYIGTCMHIYFY